MSARHRPVLSLLLLVLVATWGTCPCLFAKMLRRVQGETTTAAVRVVAGTTEAQVASTPPPCCCRKVAPTPESGKAPVPNKDDCPCCKRGGWMRDLPPQVEALALAAPGVSPFDLALGELPCLAQHALEVHAASAPTRPDGGPPGLQRPHVAPVGVVILLL